jgi:hypothetical protein
MEAVDVFLSSGDTQGCCARIADVALEGIDAGCIPFGSIELFLVAASNDHRVTALVKLLG